MVIDKRRNNSGLAKSMDQGEILEHGFEALFLFPGDEVAILEACFQTHIEVKLLYEETERLNFALDTVSFQKGDLVLDQRVLLQHGETGENLLYMASLLRLDSLSPHLRASLQVHNHQPLGRLLRAIAPRQTMVTYERQPGGQLGVEYFALDLQAPCIARTIQHTLAIPVMLVYEMMPIWTAR
jgi:hypothetical protein